MLQIKNLTKKFGGSVAVDDISLQIGSGEIFACIGPNGSGKTTTIKMLAGVYLPSSGNVVIGGKDIGAEPEAAKSLVGYIPDEPYIYEKMSGKEFLGFVGTLYDMHDAEKERGINELITLFPGLEEVIDEFVENYSRGNKQKLACVAAFLHRPKLLLVDEPMVGLDPQSAITVKKLLKDFARDGGAVFLCTHSLPVAEELASRIGILDKGKLTAIGTLEEFRANAGKSQASLEELYLGVTRHK